MNFVLPYATPYFVVQDNVYWQNRSKSYERSRSLVWYIRMHILRLLVSVKNAFIPPSWIRKTDPEPLCTVIVFSFAPKRVYLSFSLERKSMVNWLHVRCTRSVRLSYLSNVNICQVYDDLTERIELSARNFPFLRDAAV